MAARVNNLNNKILTDEQVRLIRWLALPLSPTGRYQTPSTRIAEMFGVSCVTISDVVRGASRARAWKGKAEEQEIG